MLWTVILWTVHVSSSDSKQWSPFTHIKCPWMCDWVKLYIFDILSDFDFVVALGIPVSSSCFNKYFDFLSKRISIRCVSKTLMTPNPSATKSKSDIVRDWKTCRVICTPMWISVSKELFWVKRLPCYRLQKLFETDIRTSGQTDMCIMTSCVLLRYL